MRCRPRRHPRSAGASAARAAGGSRSARASPQSSSRAFPARCAAGARSASSGLLRSPSPWRAPAAISDLNSLSSVGTEAVALPSARRNAIETSAVPTISRIAAPPSGPMRDLHLAVFEVVRRHRQLVERAARQAGLRRRLVERRVDGLLHRRIFDAVQEPREIGHARAVRHVDQRPQAGVAHPLVADAGAGHRLKAFFSREIGDGRPDLLRRAAAPPNRSARAPRRRSCDERRCRIAAGDRLAPSRSARRPESRRESRRRPSAKPPPACSCRRARGHGRGTPARRHASPAPEACDLPGRAIFSISISARYAPACIGPRVLLAR